MNKWLNKKLDKKRRTGKGFTLIELIVVVTVLGILAAIVIYAVGNLDASATKSASGTSQSEVQQAEQAYCQTNNVYGTVQQLVAAGFLNNPNPATTIYVNSIPANAQLFAACGTSVYDVYPQTIIEPDGSSAIIPAPPSLTNIVTVDNVSTPAEELAALGVTPYGGVEYNRTNDEAEVFGPLGITPLVNTAGYVNFGPDFAPNVQLLTAAKPSLFVGDEGSGTDNLTQLEAIAPVVSMDENGNVPQSPNQPFAVAPAGDPSQLSWLPALLQLAMVLNLQAQAAAFVTAFQNAANAVIPSLRGKTVSFLIPLTSGSTFLEGPADQYSTWLSYIGLTVAYCPGCTGVSKSLSSEQITAANISGQYLLIGTYSDPTDGAGDSTTYSQQQLVSPGILASLPQVAQPMATCGLASCVWGPNMEPSFGTPNGTTGIPGATTPSLPSPLSGYCSTAGVSVNSYGNVCPGYPTPAQNAAGVVGGPAPFTPSYSPVTLPLGVYPTGPISQLAAMQYVPADLAAGYHT